MIRSSLFQWQALRTARCLLNQSQSSKGQKSFLQRRLQILHFLFGDCLLLHADLSYVEMKRLFWRVALVMLVASICLFLWPIGSLLLVPYLFLERLSLRHRAKQRVFSFEKDYIALLLMLSSSVRTGIDPVSFLACASSFFPKKSEIGKELQRFTFAFQSGMTEEKALQEFARSLQHPDLPLFRSALLLARREGSSLSHCLRRLAKSTRSREAFRKKVRAAVAMQKLSAFGIGACALFLFLFQLISNREGVFAALQNSMGFSMILIGLVLMLGGVGWMLYLCRVRV